MKKISVILCLSIILVSSFNIFAQKPTLKTQEIKKDPMEKVYYVELTTEFGTMKIKLFNETPKHRDNFVKLVSEGFYDSLLFHRIIKGFMIQGGDPQSKNATPNQMLGNGDVGYKIPAEFVPGLFHKKGVLAAARDNNPEMASSGCQFYIVQGKQMNDNEITSAEARMRTKMTDEQKTAYKTIGGSPWLDGQYTVFGEVVEGLDIIDKIAAVPTQPGDRPVTDVRMTMKLVDK